MATLTLKQLIIELEENLDEFEEHQRTFLQSVIKFYKEKGSVTEAQRDYLDIYYSMLISSLGLDDLEGLEEVN